MPVTDKILTIYVDWDYDTFCRDEHGHFHLWDDRITEEGPSMVCIEGYPACGEKLEKTLAKRVGPFTYALERSNDSG